jgi:predicted nucleotide-binding protein
MSVTIFKILDCVEKTVIDLRFETSRGNLETTGTGIGRLRAYSECLKLQLPVAFANLIFRDFDRHLSFMEKFLVERNFGWIIRNLSDIEDSDLPAIKQRVYRLVEKAKIKQERPSPLSNRVFIVHGRDHESVKELKAILTELNLNPVILHEQPSGGRTVVEKLEKYSDVGYAFAILTPDDGGFSNDELRKLIVSAIGKDNPTKEDIQNLLESDDPSVALTIFQAISLFRQRARQNVVMEFGYFMGLLGRARVCCLYKGDVELPSDMQGIVYIPFQKSVHEARNMIVGELRAAGYKIPT